VSDIDSFKITLLIFIDAVYRVNWLKAKARVDRWQEELILVKHEMQWTVLWFQYQSNLWRERSERVEGIVTMGHQAYAKKQEKLWKSFEKKSSERFGLYLA
jgi:hypothetical protein